MTEARTGHGVPPLLVRTSSGTRRLTSGHTYTIGRDSQAVIQISDARVSWRHAVLRVDGGCWVLEDLGSRNGTFVASGARIARLEITGPCAIWLSHPGDGPVLRLKPDPDPAPGSSTMYAGSPEAASVASAEDDYIRAPVLANPREDHPVYGGQPSGGWAAPGAGASPGIPAGLAPPQPEGEPGRYLKGQCPGGVRVGETFSVLVSIVLDASGNAPLKYFPVGSGGRDVVVVLNAPGCQVLSGSRGVIHVPPGANSEPVMFELSATSPGPLPISVTAWLGGTYLGELAIEVTAARYRIWRAAQRDTVAVIDTTATRGAVSLVVRYDPAQNAYRFEFRDEDNPEEVTSQLAYTPGPLVEHLLAGLEQLARGRGGYAPAEARDYLVNAGAGLWQELIPARLREQFWERRDRISQLTILTDRDTVPWELLYPFDRGQDAGFLVEQFPVTRLVFGRRPPRSLSLSPPWFVLPDGSPSQAREEVDALLRLFRFQPTATEPVIGALTPLLELIRSGDFGLLHFACHNAFDPGAGSAISLDKRQFTPTQLNTAAVGRVLARSAPTVFINACRSAGSAPSYRELDGWARKFLDAGAAAFIGSLWAVRDSTARDFASELYGHLQTGTALGEAVMRARRTAAGSPGDPTWLAYTVYGDPRATVR